MTSSSKISAEFDKITKTMQRKAKIALNKAALDLVSALDAVSPVDTGAFRASWDFKEDVKTPGILAQITVFNSMPYAGPLDLGSPKGGVPWPSAGPKTVEREGRIFSSQAPDGVVGPILDETYLNDLQKRMSIFVLGDL